MARLSSRRGGGSWGRFGGGCSSGLEGKIGGVGQFRRGCAGQCPWKYSGRRGTEDWGGLAGVALNGRGGMAGWRNSADGRRERDVLVAKILIDKVLNDKHK